MWLGIYLFIFFLDCVSWMCRLFFFMKLGFCRQLNIFSAFFVLLRLPLWEQWCVLCVSHKSLSFLIFFYSSNWIIFIDLSPFSLILSLCQLKSGVKSWYGFFILVIVLWTPEFSFDYFLWLPFIDILYLMENCCHIFLYFVKHALFFLLFFQSSYYWTHL